MATTQADSTTITIPGRFFFAHVFQPTTGKGANAKPKYSVSFAWAKTDKATTAAVKAAYEAACSGEQAKKKWGGQPTNGSIRDVIQDGDSKRAGRPEYKGMFYVAAKSDSRPTVSKVVNGKLADIFEESEFYSGCIGKLNCNLYPFSAEGKRAIAVGLNHVLKTKDAEKLTGRTTNPEDAFADEIEDDGLGELSDELDELG